MRSILVGIQIAHLLSIVVYTRVCMAQVLLFMSKVSRVWWYVCEFVITLKVSSSQNWLRVTVTVFSQPLRQKKMST